MAAAVTSRWGRPWAAALAGGTAVSGRRAHLPVRRISYARASMARCSMPLELCGTRSHTDMDLSVSIGSLTLANPLVAASGCFGYGVEYADVVDLSTLGGVAVKGLFLSER